jgi:hypothetical protein
MKSLGASKPTGPSKKAKTPNSTRQTAGIDDQDEEMGERQSDDEDQVGDSMDIDDITNAASDDDPIIPKNPTWKGDAYVTNANFQAKKFTFLLFINRTPSLRT